MDNQVIKRTIRDDIEDIAQTSRYFVTVFNKFITLFHKLFDRIEELEARMEKLESKECGVSS